MTGEQVESWHRRHRTVVTLALGFVLAFAFCVALIALMVGVLWRLLEHVGP